MSNTSRSAARNFVAFFISGLAIVAAILIVVNRQYSLDVITNWTYEPSTAINSIVERTGLTDKGKFAFFATRPEVLEQDQFNDLCPRKEAGSPILGCYTVEDRIYMYNVSSKELDGMKEVTAAHELLHAVWQRTSDEDKATLETQLKAAYEGLSDEALKTRMAYYERTEPGEFINELHSILGTETTQLSPELDTYFAQFFDRKKVLELHDNYSVLYLELSARADVLFEQMNKTGASIDAATKAYNEGTTAYSKDTQDFNSRAQAGIFTTNAQFNRERAALIARSSQLEAERVAINASIETYNQYYAEYQKIADQLKVLNEGMDSYNAIEQSPAM